MPTLEELQSGEPVTIDGVEVRYLGQAVSGSCEYEIAGRRVGLEYATADNVARLAMMIRLAAEAGGGD